MSGCVDGKVEGVVGDLERENRGSVGVTNALWKVEGVQLCWLIYDLLAIRNIVLQYYNSACATSGCGCVAN